MATKQNRIENGTNENNEKIIYIPAEKPFQPKCGLGELLFKALKQHIAKDENLIAQINPENGETLTYKEYLRQSILVGQNLRRKGLVPGDVISLYSYNNMQCSQVVLASLFIGTNNAPIDPTAPFIDVVHCLKLTTPKVIFCESEFEEIVEKAVNEAGLSTEIVVFEKTNKHTLFTEYLEEDENEPIESFRVHEVTDFFSTACINFSSGTTGFPKAVCVTQYALLFIIDYATGKFDMRKTMMIVVNPYWISNVTTFLINMIAGDVRIIEKKFDVKTFAKHVQDYKVQAVMITPANGSELIRHPEYYKTYDLSSLFLFVTGGSPTTPKQIKQYKKIFTSAIILGAYGMTESGGLATDMKDLPSEIDSKVMSYVGTPVPGFKYKFVDPETEELLGPYKEGELRLKYDGLFKAYYNNPKAYEASFDEDGYFKTGDILYYDDDYNFYYTNRYKDIFKYLGWHITPQLIEIELMRHPNIIEAVVFGIKHETDGELPTAVVVAQDKNKFNEKEIIEFIKDALPDKYHLRGGVYLLDSIPTTLAGKVQRRKLPDLVAKM